MAIYFADGDYTAANFLIQQVGVVDIWLTGLIAGLSALLMIAMLYIIIEGWSKIRHHNWPVVIGLGLLTGIGIGVIPAAYLVGWIGGVILSHLVFRPLLKSKLEKVNKKRVSTYAANLREGIIRTYVGIVAILALYTAISTYPASLISILSMTNHSKLYTYILTTKDNYYIADDSKTNKILYINKSKVEDISLCSVNSGFLSDSLAHLINKNNALVSACPKGID